MFIPLSTSTGIIFSASFDFEIGHVIYFAQGTEGRNECEFWMEALRGSMFLLIPTETSRLYHEKSICRRMLPQISLGYLIGVMDLSHSQNYTVDPKAEVVLASLQSCKKIVTIIATTTTIIVTIVTTTTVIVIKAYYWMPVRYC